jgi:hypothetical protein
VDMTSSSLAVMKNAIFWDVMPCSCCKNRCFGGMYHCHHHGQENQQARKIVSCNLQFKHSAKKH